MEVLAQTVTVGKQEFACMLRRHARSRRLSMRYDAMKRIVIITAPKRIAMRRITAFIMQHHVAMAAHIAAQPETMTLDYGSVIPVFGTDHMLTRGSIDQHHIIVKQGTSPFMTRLRHACAPLLHARINAVREQLLHHQDFSNARLITRITLRDTRSRWGSCGENGAMMFSWRLVFMPAYVADYIIIHELCHLVHLDHSPAFWQLCAAHCPDMQEAKLWLKRYGKDVFRY